VKHVQGFGRGTVHLVDHNQLGDLGGADIGQDYSYRIDLTAGIRIRAIHHVYEQVSAGGLLQR